MIKGVIFDIGGVLAYDIQEYLFGVDNSTIVTRYHLDTEKVKDVTVKLWQKYAHTKQDHEERWQEVEQEYWNEFKKEIGLEVSNADLISLSEEYIRPVPGMLALLDWLIERNFDLMICSNNCEFWFQRLKLKAGFGKYFEKRKVILSNHFGVPKHEGTFTMFNALEKQMEYPKEDYIFVDDRKKNIDAALKFGILPLLFPAEASYGHLYVKEIIKKINHL